MPAEARLDVWLEQLYHLQQIRQRMTLLKNELHLSRTDIHRHRRELSFLSDGFKALMVHGKDILMLVIPRSPEQ